MQQILDFFTAINYQSINWNTSNITTTSLMFRTCKSLSTINTSSWNLFSLKDSSGMFMSCKSLTSIDLSNANSGKLLKVGGMFSDCTSLVTCDLSGFDFSNVTEYLLWGDNMFSGCTSLTTVYVKDASAKTFIDARLSESGLTITSIIKS